MLSGLTLLADRHRWRLVLIGDPHQLQAVSRGGLFQELTSTGRTHHLDRIHRFTNRWEATASLHLRHGEPRAIDTYRSHGRITAGPLDEHIDTIARTWLDVIASGATVAVTAAHHEHRAALARYTPWRAAIADAEHHLADIVENARPERQRLDTATRRIEAIESATRSLDLLDNMTRHDTRLTDLERLSSSLDTWERWARGEAVDTPTIRAAADQLAGNVRGGHQLAAIVDDIEHLPSQPTPQIPPRSAVRPGARAQPVTAEDGALQGCRTNPPIRPRSTERKAPLCSVRRGAALADAC